MSQLPESRKPLLWKDVPFADRPKAHPSTEPLEIEKLQERVTELEARVAAADKLANLMAEGECLWREDTSNHREWWKERETALAAYQATKEGE